MEKFPQIKTEFEEGKMEQFVLEFYDLMEKEEVEDTAQNRKKIFETLVKKHDNELDKEEVAFLKKAVLMKEEKKEPVFVGSKKERRNYIN